MSLSKIGPVVTPRLPSAPEDRPLPLRAYSETGPSVVEYSGSHVRRKSTRPRLDPPPSSLTRRTRQGGQSLSAVSETRENALSPSSPRSNILTPPITPQKDDLASPTSPPPVLSEGGALSFDFSKLDYELDRARTIGNGLWSSVYLAQPMLRSPWHPRSAPSTPPLLNDLPPCSVFAVKVAARSDAQAVFLQEARNITMLQQQLGAHQYIVPFLGIDRRNGSLLFEGVLGGSLESLTRRLKVMTELERHLELRSLFPKIAHDLITGLEFVHNTGLVHADIKPANVLLDISDQDQHNLVVRARYIDFSASFVPGRDSVANAGGSWDFMAPEQLRIQKDLNTPTFASDIWSLGISLLSIIVGGSPYQAACGDNLFMLREAIKSGDALGFARMDPIVQKRMAACQDFVDCCRLALQRDRARRVTATMWKRWLEVEGI